MKQAWLLILGLALVAGCAQTKKSPTTQYTVARDVRRDTQKAREDNDRAADLLAKNKHDEAERLLKKALAADALFGPAHNNLGKVYYHKQRLYDAAWEFEYASKLMPDQPEPYNNLGLVYEASSKLDDAIAQFEQALKLQPDNPQYIGNLVRARIRRGDRGPEIKDLLTRLIMHDTRPQWVTWAKDKLNLMGQAPAK